MLLQVPIFIFNIRYLLHCLQCLSIVINGQSAQHVTEKKQHPSIERKHADCYQDIPVSIIKYS